MRAGVSSVVSSAVLSWLALATSLPAADSITNVMSSIVSYQYPNDFNSEALMKGGVISPIVSYQYFEWPGDSILQSRRSPQVSYLFQEVAFANVTLQPSPTTPSAFGLTFSVPTDLGETYVLEYKNDLSASVWDAWRVFVGDGQEKSFFEEIKREIEKLFIRIRMESGQVSLHLKIPLPGGKSWFLTVEPGGESFCGKPIDEHHLPDDRYFSLDFDDLREGGANGVHEEDVSVLVAAYGVVVRKYESATYGWTVIVDLDAPYNEFPSPESGYTTLYAHMKSEPIVEQGDEVFQGNPIGIVGNTGVSTGTHVHFEVRYNGDSRSGVEELRRVRLEGLLLEGYKVGCNLEGTGFYPSTNAQR